MAQRIDPQRLRDVLDLAIAARRVQSDAHAATAAGITPPALSNMLAGRRSGRTDVQEALAAVFGVHVRTITTTEPHALEQIRARAEAAAAKKLARDAAARKAKKLAAEAAA